MTASAATSPPRQRLAHGGVVPFSGIDGPGRSTQARALDHDPALRAVAAPVKRALGWVAARREDVLRPERMPERSPWDPPSTDADIAARRLRVRGATAPLEDVHGNRRGAGLPGRVLQLPHPEPLVAFWLDADPEAAYARKREEDTSAQLTGHRARHDAVHARLSAMPADAKREPADIVRETCRRLP